MQRRVRSDDWHRHDHLRFVIICGSRGSIGFNLQATVRLHCAPERAPVQRYTSPNASSTPLSIPFKPQTKTCVAEDLGCRLASICGLACSVCRCSAMTYVIASSQSFSLIAFGTVYRRSAPAAPRNRARRRWLSVCLIWSSNPFLRARAAATRNRRACRLTPACSSMIAKAAALS